MFNFLWSSPKKQLCAPCVHPRWEIVKEVAFPSIAEQMQLETLPPSERAAILSKLQPSDFNKSFLMVMSCPFCGEVKEFRNEQAHVAERACNHQWEVHDIVLPSNFEKTCGLDANFEQRRQVAAKMEPNDFSSAVQRRMICKICGKYTDHTFAEERDGVEANKRCAHQWKTILGDALDSLKNKYHKDGQYQELRIQQAVLLTCEICGATVTRELHSVITLHPTAATAKRK